LKIANYLKEAYNSENHLIVILTDNTSLLINFNTIDLNILCICLFKYVFCVYACCNWYYV